MGTTPIPPPDLGLDGEALPAVLRALLHPATPGELAAERAVVPRLVTLVRAEPRSR